MKNIVLILLLFTTITKAKTNYDLNSAITTALENNHNIKIAKYNLETAQKDVSEAYGYAMPRLDLNAGFNRALIRPKAIFVGGGFANMFPAQLMNWMIQSSGIDPAELGGEGDSEYQSFVIGSNHNFNTHIELVQPIFDYSVFTGIGSSAIYEKARVEVLNAEEAATVKNTKIAYFSSILAKESVELVKSSLENARKRYDEITILFENGLISEYDQLRAGVQVENLKTELANTETNYINALNNLKLVLGIDGYEEVELIGSFQKYLSDTQVPELEETLAGLLSQNPDLRAVDYQIQVQDAFVDLNRAEYLPKLNLYANYTRLGQSQNWDFFTVDQSELGVRFSMNIFNGFQTNIKVEKAQINKQIAITQKLLLTQSLKNNTESVILRMENAKKQIVATESNVKQAQRAYEISQVRFNEGVGSQLEMNDADLALRQATVNYLNAAYNFLSAKAEYENLIGKIN